MYFMDAENPLKVLPNITYDHISPTPYSVMRVDLAAQILSSTMASVLNHQGGNELSGTSKYCDIINQFFDCMNVRSVSEYIQKRKDKVAPYTAIDDELFDWLFNVFLNYFDTWKLSIENRGNNFSLNAQSKMFISWQTFERFKITTNAIVEVTKFLLPEGVEFVPRMKSRNTLVTRDNWVGVLIIQIYNCLGIMTTQFVYKKMYRVLVVIQEGDMTKEITG